MTPPSVRKTRTGRLATAASISGRAVLWPCSVVLKLNSTHASPGRVRISSPDDPSRPAGRGAGAGGGAVLVAAHTESLGLFETHPPPFRAGPRGRGAPRGFFGKLLSRPGGPGRPTLPPEHPHAVAAPGKPRAEVERR